MKRLSPWERLSPWLAVGGLCYVLSVITSRFLSKYMSIRVSDFISGFFTGLGIVFLIYGLIKTRLFT